MTSESSRTQRFSFLPLSRGATIGLVVYGVILVAGFFCSLHLAPYIDHSASCDTSTAVTLFIASGTFWPGIALQNGLHTSGDFYDWFNNLPAILFNTAVLFGAGAFFALIGAWIAKGFSNKTIWLTFLFMGSYWILAFYEIFIRFALCLD